MDFIQKWVIIFEIVLAKRYGHVTTDLFVLIFNAFVSLSLLYELVFMVHNNYSEILYLASYI